MLKRDFTEDQMMFRDAYRKFLHQEIVPSMEQWREEGIVDRAAFQKAGALGFLMIWPDEQYGGMGDEDFRFEQIIIEENQYALTGDWNCTLHSRLVGPYLKRFGNEEQKQRLFAKCVTGESILAIAMTEPDGGSDLAGMRATAMDQGDHYLLNGNKTYISNGVNADVVIVAAKTDPVNNPRHIGLFIVERGAEGFERGSMLKKMGQKGQDTAELCHRPDGAIHAGRESIGRERDRVSHQSIDRRIDANQGKRRSPQPSLRTIHGNEMTTAK